MSAALVTGGSGGVGEAVVRALRADGYEVTFTYHRRRSQAEALAAATGATPVAMDLSAAESVNRVAELIEAGSFGLLVNNAMGTLKRSLFLKTDAGDAARYCSDYVYAAFRLSQALASTARRRGEAGCIINVLSAFTIGVPPSRQSAYVTAKYALLGLSRALATELTQHGIRVNSVSPGMMRTDFIADLPELFVQQAEEKLPAKRLVRPEEVAEVVRFLASPAAAYISGANLPITGAEVF